MHIVLVNRWYPPHTGYGGIATYNQHLAQALVKLGHRITVVAARHSADDPVTHTLNGVVVHRLLTQPKYPLHRIPVAGRHTRAIRQLLYSIRLSRTLQALDRAEPIDIVEFAEVEAEGFAYLRSARRRPVIVRCHTPTVVLKQHYTPAEMQYDARLGIAMERYCIQHADALTAPSHDMARTIARVCGVSTERITVIPNPLDVERFASTGTRQEYAQITDSEFGMLAQKTASLDSFDLKFRSQLSPAVVGKDSGFAGSPDHADEITVLHVGRLDRVKGIEVLAQAIPHVLRVLPHARFLFAGSDRRDEHGASWQLRLEAYFREQSVDGQVAFLGETNHQELVELYHQADIALVPSLNYESFSYTCAQAMAAGVPVIASRIGGIPETVEDGISGLLVAPGDVQELAAAIVRLACDAQLRIRMGRAGKLHAKQRFDAVSVADRFLDLVKPIMSK